MNWIGRVNKVNSKIRVSQVFNNNNQGSRLGGRPKTDGRTVYKQILVNAKLKTEIRGKKNRADWGMFLKEAKVRTGQ